MKKSVLLGVLILWITSGFGQQIPLYSQYYINPFMYNPAMTGSADAARAFLIHRSQWVDMPGSPVTTGITLDGPVKSKKIGLGIKIFNDATDIFHRISADVSYSYRINFSSENALFFGVSLGALNNRVDFSKVKVKDNMDPYLFKQAQDKTSINGTGGISYVFKKLEVGFAIPQLAANAVTFDDNSSRAFYNMARHYLGSIRYGFDIQKEKEITFSPLVLVRMAPGAPVQYDINAILNWSNLGWVAATYRSDYAYTANVGIRLNKNFTIGYAYDFITSKIGGYAGTSHEILIGFTFDNRNEKKDAYVEEKKVEPKDTLSDKIKKLENQIAENNKDIKGMDSTLKSHLKDSVQHETIILTKQEEAVVEEAFKNLEFEFNKAIIEESSNESLDKLAQMLNVKKDYKLLISGHTDNIGSLMYNFQLSEDRVFAVKKFLVGKGIIAERIITEEYAFTRPVETNKTPEGRSKNRRVEFKIIK